MRIVVYYLSAEDKGGLFVLKSFYNDVVHSGRLDIEWYFLASVDGLKNRENVKIIKLKKENALRRLVFENTKLASIINKLSPDLIISLQNMPIRGCKQPQFVYLHQSLQYCPKSFSFMKPSERAMAVRQHLICNMYRLALPKADHIFVQTEWIKEATEKWIKKDKNNITVVPVRIDQSSVPIKEYTGQKTRTFFYPTRAEVYKNNEVIIKACSLLDKQGVKDYEVLLTFSPDDSLYSREIEKKIGNLPIQLIGSVPYDQIWEYYSKTILLFPSYLETCGLPLVEARAAKGRILASDLPFSHEALDNYPNADFFKYDDAEGLAALMVDWLEEPQYEPVIAGSMKSETLLQSMLNQLGE